MTNRNNNYIERAEKWLDERFNIYEEFNRKEDYLFYEGAIRAIEMIGYTWERNNSGKHIIYKN